MQETLSGPNHESTSQKPALTHTYSPDSWPKTYEGVVDWEKVFEHPEAGFIPCIKNAQDPASLKTAVLTTIEKLFTRKGDKEEILGFVTDLENIFANCDFVETRSAVIVLLRNIKEHRIQKCDEYLLNKHMDEAQERRTNKKDGNGLSLAPFKFVKLTPQETGVMFGSFTFAIAACVMGLIALVGFDSFLGLFTAENSTPQVKHIQAEEVGTAPKQGVMDKVTIAKPQAELPKDVGYSYKIKAPAIYLTVKPDGRRSYRTLYQPTIFLINDEEKTTLCRNWPMVLDALNQVLYRVHPKQEEASEQHLTRANRLAAKVINRTIGLDTVTWVSYKPTDEHNAAVDSARICRVVKA
ncbi:MAG: hypothetical protein OQJ97_13655 [Rhodospirillales bacterium]|nr:hypothetical protein [Rhodospirillales bacterium]